MNIPGLRSPHDKVGTLVYFGRMVDKIRLHAAGKLPADYIPNLGDGFDKVCAQFFGISYEAITERVNTLVRSLVASTSRCARSARMFFTRSASPAAPWRIAAMSLSDTAF